MKSSRTEIIYFLKEFYQTIKSELDSFKYTTRRIRRFFLQQKIARKIEKSYSSYLFSPQNFRCGKCVSEEISKTMGGLIIDFMTVINF